MKPALTGSEVLPYMHNAEWRDFQIDKGSGPSFDIKGWHISLKQHNGRLFTTDSTVLKTILREHTVDYPNR